MLFSLKHAHFQNFTAKLSEIFIGSKKLSKFFSLTVHRILNISFLCVYINYGVSCTPRSENINRACFTHYHYGPALLVDGKCAGGIPEARVWHTLAVNIELKKIEAYLDGSILFKTKQSVVNPQPSKVGAVVWYNHGIAASFKEFHVEEYFVPIASFPNIRSFQFPPIKDIVDSHKIRTVFGKNVSTLDTYTVSADFQHPIGSFGLCYNVIDDANFDFVYYRYDDRTFMYHQYCNFVGL